jgi:DNA-binding transcriptional MerR regulator
MAGRVLTPAARGRRIAGLVPTPCHRRVPPPPPHRGMPHRGIAPGLAFCYPVTCWTRPIDTAGGACTIQVGTYFHIRNGSGAKMLKARKTRPVSSPEAQGYNSSDVARICGVSLRQLQWWDERNVVSPRQDGHKRIYMGEEVVEISVIAELRRKGFSLQKIRRVLRFLQKDMGKRLSEALAGSADVHLLTDGKSIFLEEAPARIIDLLKNARQPMFLVCVTDQVRRLTATANAERKPARSEIASPAGRKARVG